MLRISACMITKNEENNIAKSINSYKDIVEEIIVVDSESTDGTVAIAESFGAKVYIRPWTNDFSAAKNFAMDQASGDWIIFLDADEYFAEDCGALLRDVIGQADQQGYDTILISRYELNREKNTWYGRTFIPRILKKDEVRYANAIHEEPVKHSGALRLHLADQITVYHTGYSDPDMRREKHMRNLEILLSDGAQPTEFMRLSYLAEAYYSLGEFEKCSDAVDQLLLLPEFEQEVYTNQKVFRAYWLKTDIMLKHLDQYTEEQIATWVRKSVEDFGKHPEIRTAEARYFAAYRKVDEAIDAMQTAFQMNEVYDSFYENVFLKDVADHYRMLARLFAMKNERKEAIKYMVESLRIDRYGENALFDLLCMLRKENTEDKQRILEELYALDQQEDMNYIITAAWLSGSNDVFAVYLLKLLTKWPELASSDPMLLCKIFYLQKKYDEILQIAGRHTEEDFCRRFQFVAQRAKGIQVKSDDLGFVIAVVTEMLQAGETEHAVQIALESMPEEGDSLDHAVQIAALASVFEKFGQYSHGGKLRLEAAHMLTDAWYKGIQYTNAAHVFYLADDLHTAVDVLREALPFALPGNHLSIEILGWIGERIKRNNKELYQQIRRLKAKYEVRYSATYDQPLPVREKQEV